MSVVRSGGRGPREERVSFVDDSELIERAKFFFFTLPNFKKKFLNF